MADPRQRTGRSVGNFAAAEQAFDTAARELVELTNAQGAAFAKMSFPTRRMTQFRHRTHGASSIGDGRLILSLGIEGNRWQPENFERGAKRRDWRPQPKNLNNWDSTMFSCNTKHGT
jgi:hypothetical protein